MIEKASSEKRKTWLLRGIVFGTIWAAFFAFGILVRSMMPWDRVVELHSFDYTAQGIFFADYTRILTPMFRHLLMPFITAPLPLFGRRILEVGGPWPYWCFLLFVFSAVMTGVTMLVYAILKAVQGAGRWGAAAGTALFLSFSYTWLLAACPESYPLACLAALLVLRWGQSPVSSRGWTGRAGWCALAVLNGGITTSNGVKVAFAFLAARGITRRRLMKIAIILASIVTIMLLGIWIRYFLFNLTHDETKPYISEGLVNSMAPLCANLNVDFKTWLSHVINFFSEPIVTHGDALTVQYLVRPYGNILAPLAVTMLYAVALVGAWRARRQLIIKMTLAMFMVDFLLHIVMRWGLDEGQIYCGHWLYAPAIMAAMLPITCTGRVRRACLAGLFALALAIFACGIQSFVTAPEIPDDEPELWPAAKHVPEYYPEHFYKKPPR